MLRLMITELQSTIHCTHASAYTLSLDFGIVAVKPAKSTHNTNSCSIIKFSDAL